MKPSPGGTVVFSLDVEKIKDGRIYVRKNIVEETREDKTMFVYEECLMTETEYVLYSFEAKREAEIIDEYTLSLIEGGVL